LSVTFSIAQTKGDASNAQNKWDICGQYHNDIIQDVMANKKNLSDIESYVNYANSITQMKLNLSPQEASEYSLSPNQVNTILSDKDNSYRNVIASSKYSQATKDKYSELVNIFESAKNGDEIDYSTFKNRIISFESDLQRSNLSEKEKDEVLKVSSIARYSSLFWNETLQATDGNNGSIIAAKRKWWQWLVIGIADVAGGIAGGIATGATVIGAVAGAVAGAAGASSGAATLVD
jgi:hypothetical protein